jgi:hypothetical protein
MSRYFEQYQTSSGKMRLESHDFLVGVFLLIILFTPLAPLGKGGIGVKVSLEKGDARGNI